MLTLDPRVSGYVTFKGQDRNLKTQSTPAYRPEYYQSHDQVDLSLRGDQTSKTDVQASWDVPSGELAIIATELDLKVQDKDAQANLQVQARRDEAGDTYLSITNPGEKKDSGVEVRLPDLGNVGENFLQDGYFNADGGISSVRVLFHRDTQSDTILAPSGIWINDKSIPFAAPEKPLELSQETRDLVSGIIADKKFDWL